MPVYPISLSIPESKIVTAVPAKSKRYAHIVPGILSTYVYTFESEYYEDYQKSVFGKTCKKGGWDCMRHYEIMANGCIPWFEDLASCPPRTMVHFPKSLVAEAMGSQTPQIYIEPILSYMRTHLSCSAMAQYVLTTAGHPTPRRVLFLSDDLGPDYLRCLTLTGLKQLLGTRCVENVPVPHIYDDYTGDIAQLYGKGITYTKNVPAQLRTALVSLDEIKNRQFDLVIYGSMHRGIPFWNEVNAVYAPHEIILLCGEDIHDTSMCEGMGLRYHMFIRELRRL